MGLIKHIDGEKKKTKKKRNKTTSLQSESCEAGGRPKNGQHVETAQHRKRGNEAAFTRKKKK